MPSSQAPGSFLTVHHHSLRYSFALCWDTSAVRDQDGGGQRWGQRWGQGTNLSPSIPWAVGPDASTFIPPAASIPGSGLEGGYMWSPRRDTGVPDGDGGCHCSWDSLLHTSQLVPRLQRAGEADELLITGAAWLVQRVSAARLAEPCGG